MQFLYNIYISIITFFEQGGNVLILIAMVTFLMWALIFERVCYFFILHKAYVSELVEKWNDRSERSSWHAQRIREDIISRASDKISENFSLITTCVAISPLLGLLGTVTGMINVFDAMSTQGGNARSMAAGVSTATIPTMAGMVASLSGLFGTTYLKRKMDNESESLENHIRLDH